MAHICNPTLRRLLLCPNLTRLPDAEDAHPGREKELMWQQEARLYWGSGEAAEGTEVIPRPSGAWANSRLCGKAILITRRTPQQFEKVVQAKRAIWLKTRDV